MKTAITPGEVVEAIRILTEDFQSGYSTSTMMVWNKVYDRLGRLLTPNPNTKEGCLVIEHKTYYFIKVGWVVKVWDRKATERDYAQSPGDAIATVDIKPDYVREYYGENND